MRPTAVSLSRSALVTEAAMTSLDVLISGHETTWVSETSTGLAFAPDTPIEVWAPLTVRLIVQSKRIEFALADAINFGELAYGDLYAQWVEETGLAKRTLQNIARIGRAIEPARRRAALSFSHHAEVVSLPTNEQESLLEAAERSGMTRYDLRDAARERRRELEDRAATPDPSPIDASHVWIPQRSDLTDEAREELDRRLAGIGKRHALGYERGFLDALLWTDQRDAFVEWRGPE